MTKATFEDVIAAQGKLVYTNEGDSMFPLIQPRDLLVIEAVKQPLRRFDIPLYKRESGQYVLHRIVRIGDSGNVMCGDNRSDLEYGVTDKQIIGVLTAIVRDGKTVPVAELPNTSRIKAAENLLLLLNCAVSGEAPSEEACSDMCLPVVYSLSQFHFLTAAAAIVLERTIELPRPFDQAMKKAIRKLALFDIERTAVLHELEQAGIRYLPLKGIILKDCYPMAAMREMSDNDILCDPDRMREVRDIMERLGYFCERYDDYNHDVYAKPPTLEFEMHRSLFPTDGETAGFAAYFADIWDRLVPVSACGYAMTEKDFYCYLLCHAFKHYSHAGTGLRSLLDIFLFLRAHPAFRPARSRKRCSPVSPCRTRNSASWHISFFRETTARRKTPNTTIQPIVLAMTTAAEPKENTCSGGCLSRAKRWKHVIRLSPGIKYYIRFCWFTALSRVCSRIRRALSANTGESKNSKRRIEV